jgi:large subunit ribosomal protein L6
MSRIGKLPVAIPKNVSVKINNLDLHIKGPHGELSHRLPHGFSIVQQDQILTLVRPTDSGKDKALHGLHRALINNKITGVSEPFKKVLEISGVGYRAQLSGQNLSMTLGFTKPVELVLPPQIKGSVEKQTIITLVSFDKELLGKVSSEIRQIRPVEPYKGKGIRFEGEKVRRKEGKTGKK